jgi:hypothetical protein
MKKKSGNSCQPTAQPEPLVRGPRSNKAKGDVAELAFLHKAASLGFGVAKPYGDDEHYDFILDSGERFWRVQVRSTSCEAPGNRDGYIVSACRSSHRYTPTSYQTHEIDIFVAYIVPLGVWYIIPVNQVASAHCLSLHPSGCRGGGCFEAFREAWHLMAPGADLPQPRTLRHVRTRDFHRKHFVE